MKKISVIISGADRALWDTTESVHVSLIDNNGGGTVGAKDLVGRELPAPIFELDLEVPFDAGQAYVLLVSAPAHKDAWQTIWRQTFLREEDGREVEKPDAVLRIMLLPDDAKSSDLARGFQELAERGSVIVPGWAKELPAYDELSIPQQMALLNIEAKIRETWLGTQRLASFVVGIRGIDPDRLFLLVQADLKHLVERSRDFSGAAGHDVAASHPTLPSHPDSWKHTVFSGGEIQLSFSTSPERWPPTTGQMCYSVDADIDLDRGLGHASEWLDNNVLEPGKKTDQRLVYALLFAQQICPWYTLDPAGA